MFVFVYNIEMSERPAAARRDHREDRGRAARRSHRGGAERAPIERRTQAERSAETTTKLLDATAACLADLGYARTSTTEICRRAGVSRGAMLHHFPSKAVLVAAACEHIFRTGVDEFRAVIEAVPAGTDHIDVAIDTLWALFQGETFAAWFELITAGRTDADLRPHVALVADRMRDTTAATWNELFDPPPAADAATAELYDTAPLLIFAVLEGLAVTRMTAVPGAAADAERVLDQVKAAANALRTPGGR